MPGRAARLAGAVFLAAALLAAACGKDQQATTPGTTPGAAGPKASGAMSLELVPTAGSRTTTFKVIPHGVDLTRAEVAWMVNESVARSQDIVRFDASDTRPGDKVYVRAVVDGKEIVSNTVEIGNSLPVIAHLKFEPEVFKPGDRLRVDAKGEDADGDDVEFNYAWKVNDEEAGEGSILDRDIRRGDRVEVNITPYDGIDEGKTATLKREIKNFPPVITSGDESGFDGDVFTYNFAAEDPDGDTLTYSKKSGPEGMTIDPATGAVRWEVPKEFAGLAEFTLAASDGNGGTAEKLYKLRISAPGGEAPAPAAKAAQ